MHDRAQSEFDRQLYSPAMLAELVHVPVRTVRRWQRAGFIRPVTEIMQLPQFDFAGLSTARQLAAWMRQGATVPSIQTQLESLRARAGQQVAIDDLPIMADGKRLILREGDHYVEASGQLRLGFEASDEQDDDAPVTIRFQLTGGRPSPESFTTTTELDLESMIDEAIAAEDEGDFEAAIRWYRCALSAHGPSADICFQLAELLYRTHDISGARERYFMALEIDADLVEARANLGCVLVECGQVDLAIAAFEGALEQFPDYADVHFHLARALDEYGESGRAAEHWQRFLELAPASPWADEAHARLSEHIPLEFEPLGE
jgi:tetratricopeptide (TPR) repeat protein